MPTVFSHPAPVLALGLALGKRAIPWRLILAGALCALAPDLDAIGWSLGLRYGSVLAHRGFSHSLCIALTLGCLGAGLAPWLRCGRLTAFLVLSFGAASHILLDAMTNGGSGVAALWPLTEARYFLPWRPIQVSPMSLKALLGDRGLTVLRSELCWVWLPCFGLALLIRLARFDPFFRSRPGQEPVGEKKINTITH